LKTKNAKISIDLVTLKQKFVGKGGKAIDIGQALRDGLSAFLGSSLEAMDCSLAS
jgi:hypothetical protein